MLTLIKNGDLFAPAPQGRQSLLLVDGKIGRIGNIDQDAVESLGIEVAVIDAEGCLVTPGLIDPHEHLLGGSGEQGFSTQSPEISLGEIVRAGVTTVVGCLGVDTTMKTLPGLLAKVKGLCEEGLTARMWTGGYNIPPTTLSGSVRNDIMFIAEVIGCGEVAISDERSTEPDPRELARVVNDAYVGGMLSGKAGITHFHVGDLLDGAAVVFFTGGGQLRITTQFGGTELCEQIQEFYRQGGTIAGTSAGASVMSDTMLVSGEGEVSHRVGSKLMMAPGLGYLKDVIIDQHFAERGRIGRLLAAVAQNPRLLGIGLDENTAIIVEQEQHFRVLGGGGAYVVDGREMTCTNLTEEDDDRTASIFNVRLHLLSQGDEFNLLTRVPLKRSAESIEKEFCSTAD